MATVTLHPASGSDSNSVGDPAGSADAVYNLVGTGDAIDAVTTAGDGKYIHFTNNVFPSLNPWGLFSLMFDYSGIPVGSPINSLQFIISHRFTGGSVLSGEVIPYIWNTRSSNPLSANSWPADILNTGNFATFDAPNNGLPALLVPNASFTTWTATANLSDPNTAYNPFTTLPWVRGDINGTWFGFEAGGAPSVGPVASNYDVDYIAMVVDYTIGGTPIWYYNPVTNHYQYTSVDPGDPWQPKDPGINETKISPVFGSTLGGD